MKAKEFLKIEGIKKIEKPFFIAHSNWTLYAKENKIYYIANPGTGCDSGVFGDINHLKKSYAERYLMYAISKGLFLSLSIAGIFSIERLVGGYVEKQIS